MKENTILIRHELDKNPTEFSENDFVNIIMQDIEVAKAKYSEITTAAAEERYKSDLKDYLERREQEIEKIINESYKRYTREFFRLQWVEKEMAKWPNEYKRCYWHNGEELTYIDWSMEPWKMGTKSVSLDSKEDIKNFFIKRFKEDFNNKYFSQCMGWEIVVNQRPYFRLILSPELQAEWDADEKRLSDSVTRFYSGSNYWGD